MHSWKEVMVRAVERQMQSMCTSIPAEVVSVTSYQDKCVVDVQPKIADIDPEDFKSQKMPIIAEVPIQVLSGGGAIISAPIKPGDVVMLVFSMRNMQNWKEGDNQEISTPTDARRFHITDAVAIPCIYQMTDNLHPNPDDLELRFKDSIVRLKEDGNITISTQGNILIEEAVDIEINNSGNTTVNTAGNLTANVEGTTDIVSSGDVTIDTANTTITGELRVDGGISAGNDVETDAGITLNTHKHIGNLSTPTSPSIP